MEHTTIAIHSQKKLQSITEQPFSTIPCLFINQEWLFNIDTMLLYLYNLIPSNQILHSWHHNTHIQNYEHLFNHTLYHQIYYFLYYEKIINPFYNIKIEPSASIIKHTHSQLHEYLQFFNEQLITQNWITNNQFTLNDITCFSFLVTLDYCGFIPWNKYISLKKWFLRMKSQHQYNFILQHKIHFYPVPHYDSIDF